MKVGIVTLHSSFSYGACLQAYATYAAIKDMGHDAEFVDYINAYEQSQNHWLSRKADWSAVKNISTTVQNVFLGQYRNRIQAFKSFHESCPKSLRFTNTKQMDTLVYDALVSGSDQLWNPAIFGELDETFFLNFGTAKKRIAYAASAGSHTYTQEEKERVSQLLSRYTAISARETQLKEQLEEITEKSVAVVADPTFLLTPQRWRSMAEECPSVSKGKYILLYMIGVPYSYYKTHYAPIVKFYKEKLGLPVYAICPLSFPTYAACDRNLTHLTPRQLVRAIDDAELVISSSFHGIAFSIHLNKKFVALKTANPNRIANLLRVCQMEERCIDRLDVKICSDLLAQMDYGNANAALERLRESSYTWLKERLEDEIDS